MTHQRGILVHNFEGVQQQQFHSAALAAVDHQCPLSLVSHFLNKVITESLFHILPGSAVKRSLLVTLKGGNWPHVQKCWLMNQAHVEIGRLPKKKYKISNQNNYSTDLLKFN